MRTPPLNALRSFESAGRLMSFTLAAEELCVTPGAVSRQIKLLEEFLNIQLFERNNREISLTPQGVVYLRSITDVFAKINLATSILLELPDKQPIRLSTSNNSMLHWLMPRLSSYYYKNPDANLQILTSSFPLDFIKNPLDVAIRPGHEDTPNATITPLSRPDLVLVCSPRLLEQTPLRTMVDLEKHTLIQTPVQAKNWETWLSGVGFPSFKGARYLNFENSSLAHQAVIEGLGVAVFPVTTLLKDLKQGGLVSPIPLTVPCANCYNVIWSDKMYHNKRLVDFVGWLKAEAKQTDTESKAICSKIKQGFSYEIGVAPDR